MRNLLTLCLYAAIAVTLLVPSAAFADDDPVFIGKLTQFKKQCDDLAAEKDRLVSELGNRPPPSSQQERDRVLTEVKNLSGALASVQAAITQAKGKDAEAQQSAAAAIYRTLTGAVALETSLRTAAGEAPSGPAERALASNIESVHRLGVTLPNPEDFKYKISKGFDGALVNGPIAGVNDLVPVTSSYRTTTVVDATRIVQIDRHLDGGVTLEGGGATFPRSDTATFDSRYNALTLKNGSVYFLRTPPWITAELCRIVAADPNGVVGVSLTQTSGLVSGRMQNPQDFLDTPLIWDMMLADHFLGGIAFGQGVWHTGYMFPNEFTPQSARHFGPMIVRFTFGEFEFRTKGNQIQATHAKLSVRLIPTSEMKTEDGGARPDMALLRKGYNPPAEFVRNVENITENYDYYERERIVRTMFECGETAAVLRRLKASGANLLSLAQSMQVS